MVRKLFILFPVATWVLLPVSVRSSDQDDLISALHAFSSHPTHTAGNEWLHVPKQVADFYRARGNRPAWFEKDGKPNHHAVTLRQAIGEVARDGLSPEHYHAGRLQVLSPDPSTELLLTDAFLTLGSHLFSGVIQASTVEPDWAIPPRPLDMKKQLEQALVEGVAERLQRLSPKDERYEKLKAALAAYRKEEESGPFPVVETGPPLQSGSRGRRVEQLHLRLSREGYLAPESPPSPLFDSETEMAVQAFQASHGLEGDGVVGRQTLAELNVPIADRIRQLLVNLERLRWLPRALGDRYLFVDIADFALTVFESGKPVLTMRIIVGDDHRETPMFSAAMTSIVVNPSWLIPQSIVQAEILPELRSHPSFLRRKGIRVLANRGGKIEEIDPTTVDWSQVDADRFPYLLEQPSGPQNPLGPLKFLFPNRFAVYLHGTPEVELFQRARRSLSHGCIRVENPVALAAFLLKDSIPSWSVEEIRKSISQGTTVSIPLISPVPVYLWYRTAWVGEDGRLQFRHDLYGWDTLLWNALEGKTLLSQGDAVLAY